MNFEFLLFGYLADLFTIGLQVLGEICEQGYSDAFKFLKENGMLLLWIIIGDMLLTCVFFSAFLKEDGGVARGFPKLHFHSKSRLVEIIQF